MKDVVLECPFEDCKKIYTNKFNLKRHIDAIHADNKRFQCMHCHKSLSSKQNLKEHEFTHSGQKPYVCTEPGCGLRFRQGSQLSSHRRIHVAVRRFAAMDDIEPLKVTSRQLTALLTSTDFIFSVQPSQPANVPVPLPPIAAVRQSSAVQSVLTL